MVTSEGASIVAAAARAGAGEGEPSALSRRERRKLEVRTRILDAARALFAERGVADTTVQGIAERADVATATFFNHFPTRRDMLREISHAGVEELTVDLEAIRKAELSTPERIHAVFDCLTHQLSEAGPHNRELLVELVHEISADPAGRSAQTSKLLAAIRGIVEEGLVRGDVSPSHDPEALTELILGAYYVLLFSYVNVDDFAIRERAESCARTLSALLTPRTAAAPTTETGG